MVYWQKIGKSNILIPENPVGIIHFLGGAFVAIAPQFSYRWLLEELANAGFVIIATPFFDPTKENIFDHREIARSTLNRFENVLERLQNTKQLNVGCLPIYGMGHSIGCKLHLLTGSLDLDIQRAGNILISFNNFTVKKAIPFLDKIELEPAQNFINFLNNSFNQSSLKKNLPWVNDIEIPSDFNLDFTPNPEETLNLIQKDYKVKRNLLIQFKQDTIDQTGELSPILKTKYSHLITHLKLSGNHLTPLSQDIQWNQQNNNLFSPLENFGQWVKQELSKDLTQLSFQLQRWLSPSLLW